MFITGATDLEAAVRRRHGVTLHDELRQPDRTLVHFNDPAVAARVQRLRAQTPLGNRRLGPNEV